MNSDDQRQQIRSYLLGTLATDQRAEVEQRLLTDDELYQDLLFTEDDLVDQYVAGQLSAPERQQFEAHFLITTERQQQFRFGRAFRQYLTSHKASVPQPALSRTSRLWSFFFAPSVPQPLLASLMAIVLGGGLIALHLFLTRKTHDEVVNQTLIVALSPGATRSGGTIERLQAPPSDVNVKLLLALGPNNFRTYKAELLRESESLVIRENLKPEIHNALPVVSFTVSARTLQPADYQIVLRGESDSGQDEVVARYALRVLGP